MNAKISTLLTSLLVMLCFFSSSGQGPQKIITLNSDHNTTPFPTLVYTPIGYSTSGKNYPLIVFLHGTGEASQTAVNDPGYLAGNYLGNIFNSSSAGGPAYYIATGQWPDSFANPATGVYSHYIVISPQAPGWSTAGSQLNYIISNFIAAGYRVDLNRIYVTGLSAGGQGVIDYVNHNGVTPIYEAAAVLPMSMATGTNQAGAQIATGNNIKAWGFGSDPSDIHGVATHQQMDLMNSYTPGIARFTNYSGGHCCWGQFYTPAYKEVINGKSINMYEWMLLSSRGGTPGPSGSTPVANAGVAQTIQLPVSQASLNGSASTDAGGTITTYAWSQQSGPANATITTPSAVSTTVTGLVAGVYVFKLTITDNNNNTSSSTVQVTVSAVVNTPSTPLANAGPAQTIVQPISQVTLNGSASTDVGGTITSYAWTAMSGPAPVTIVTPSAVTTSVTGLTVGVYAFRLTITDNNGNVSLANVLVTVNAAAGSTPTANAGAAQSIQLPVSQVSLSGSGSTDAGGTITAYAWSQQSGPATATISTPSAVTTSVSGLVAGVYVFNLTITDNNNKTSTSTVQVTVLAAGGKPTPSTPLANAGPAQTIVQPVSQVTLNASASTDAGGTITSYSWVPMAGPAPVTIANSSAVSTTVTGLIAGVYVFKLTITDNNSNTSTANVMVTVTAAASSTPTSNPGTAQAIQLPVSQVTLSGAGSTDLGGTISAYSWSQQSGPATATLSTPSAVSTTATGLTAGVYIFKLTITDNNNNTSSATVQVTVSAAPVSTPTANAGTNQTVQLPLSQASLNGSASSVLNGVLSSYAWSQQSGPSTATLATPAAAITTVTGLIAGVYVFKLTITDATGKTSSATTQVTVLSAPVIPPVGGSCGGQRKLLNISGNDNGQWISGQNNVHPGDTLVLSSKYRWFYLSGDGLHGTASCPIVITNDTGQVEMTAGMAFSNSTYVHITGTGSAKYLYGFNIHSYDSIMPWQRGSSITLSDRSAFVEIDHIDEYKKSNAVVIKEEAMCADSLNAPKWRMDNFSLHDIRSRNISYEGFYLGSLSTNGENTISCNGVSSSPIPMRLSNIKLYNLIIDSIGGNAIQLSGADSGVNEISNCKISRSGLLFDPNQGAGIYLGGYTTAYVHDNNIRSTYQNGISCYGAGLMRVENNNIDSSGFLSGRTNSGVSSIVADTRLTTNKGATPAGILSTISLKNNTVGLTTNTAGAKTAYRSMDIGLSYSTYPSWSAANVICSNVLQNGSTAAEFRINPSIVYSANCSGVTGAAAGSKIMSVEGLSLDEPVANSFIIYPNPVHDVCSIRLSNSNMGNMRVLIVDVSGVVRRQYNYNKSGQSIQSDLNMGDLAAGTYFVRVQIGSWSEVRKIFKL